MAGYANSFLTELFQAGKPLVEVGISPAEGADIHEIAARLHSIAPDIELRQTRYGSNKLEGDATAEAMERLFGFKLRRVNIPKWDAELQVYDGVHEDGFMWESDNDWTSTPPELIGQIRSVGYSQPGTNDNGQPDGVSYELPPLIYEVSRMDDHGTTYPVGTVFSREEADRRIKELEAGAHKQTYFIATRQPGENRCVEPTPVTPSFNSFLGRSSARL